MKARGIFFYYILTVLLFVVPGSVFCQEQKNERKEQTPETQEMMKKWMQAVTPGEAHKILGAFVGSWDLTETIWMGGPDAPPTVTKGSALIKWCLDGRFIQQELDGEMMGKPMHGIGFTGYDNINKKYTTFWIDNTSTAMYTADGSFNQDGTVLTAYGKMDEPTTGENDKNVKYVWRVINKDKNIFEIHDLAIGEPNTKVVEMVYSRKK